jgi:hypothetical protein
MPILHGSCLCGGIKYEINGPLDEDPGVRPAAHTFVAHKAPWYEITDDLPQYSEGRAAAQRS